MLIRNKLTPERMLCSVEIAESFIYVSQPMEHRVYYISTAFFPKVLSKTVKIARIDAATSRYVASESFPIRAS
jgi:hypothetical protein